MGALEELAERYGDRAAFLVVYVREAHPEDGWVLEENREAGIALRDPTTYEERTACALRLPLSLPLLVDDLDDRVARAYGAWPERLYLVGRDGRIAYQGGRGPWDFRPEELGEALERELGQE